MFGSQLQMALLYSRFVEIECPLAHSTTLSGTSWHHGKCLQYRSLTGIEITLHITSYEDVLQSIEYS